MFVETTIFTHVLLITNMILVFLVISFTGFVMTILKFDGSSMLWLIQTKSPVPPIQSPNPTVTSWSNAAQLVAQIKFDYLSNILSWLDGVGPKTVIGWKALIGFETVFVPSVFPKLRLFAVWEVLGS